jgi:F-type H+-transporting ATPase subunit epsilon
MSAKSFHLTIITPERVVYDQDVEKVTLPTTEGEITVLADHTNLLSTLDLGPISTLAGDTLNDFAVSGGFVEVNDNKVTILANTAEQGEEIDEQRAQEAKDRAERLLKDVTHADQDQALVAASLQRALLRLKVLDRYRHRRKG